MRFLLLEKMPRLKDLPIFVLLVALLPALLAGAQQKSPTSQTAPAQGQKKTPAKPAISPKSAPSAKPKASAPPKRPARRRAAVPQQQLRPTKERYAEIQAALASAGYFSGPSNGAWGDSSAKALQQFQSSHGLEPTGKIDAQTLIQLGLGPNYGDPAQTAGTPSPPPG